MSTGRQLTLHMDMASEAGEKKHGEYEWCMETVPILVHGEIYYAGLFDPRL
jgi:hypothetical protein